VLFKPRVSQAAIYLQKLRAAALPSFSPLSLCCADQTAKLRLVCG